MGRLCNAGEVKSIGAVGVSELSCRAGRGMRCGVEKMRWERGQVGAEPGSAVWGRPGKSCFSLCLSPKIVNDSYPSLLCHYARRWPEGSAGVSRLIHKSHPKTSRLLSHRKGVGEIFKPLEPETV